jgi:hypothetical protein
LVTRFPRLVRAYAVLHPDVRCFYFDDDLSFQFAQSALYGLCIHCEKLEAEPGLTIEETLTAAERMAGLTPGHGAPE